jgi:hypothetical protein
VFPYLHGADLGRFRHRMMQLPSHILKPTYGTATTRASRGAGCLWTLVMISEPNLVGAAITSSRHHLWRVTQPPAGNQAQGIGCRVSRDGEPVGTPARRLTDSSLAQNGTYANQFGS